MAPFLDTLRDRVQPYFQRSLPGKTRYSSPCNLHKDRKKYPDLRNTQMSGSGRGQAIPHECEVELCPCQGCRGSQASMVGSQRLGTELCLLPSASQPLKHLSVRLQDHRMTPFSPFSQTNLALLLKYDSRGFPQRVQPRALSLSLRRTDALISRTGEC